MSKAGAKYARFLAQSISVVIALGLIGWLPTRRLAGVESLPAMATGCAIGLLSAVMAGWLTVMVPVDSANAKMQRALLAMGVRVAVALALGVAAALSGEFQRAPLLLWLAIAYVALLPLEVSLVLASE